MGWCSASSSLRAQGNVIGYSAKKKKKTSLIRLKTFVQKLTCPVHIIQHTAQAGVPRSDFDLVEFTSDVIQPVHSVSGCAIGCSCLPLGLIDHVSDVIWHGEKQIWTPAIDWETAEPSCSSYEGPVLPLLTSFNWFCTSSRSFWRAVFFLSAFFRRFVRSVRSLPAAIKEHQELVI